MKKTYQNPLISNCYWFFLFSLFGIYCVYSTLPLLCVVHFSLICCYSVIRSSVSIFIFLFHSSLFSLFFDFYFARVRCGDFDVYFSVTVSVCPIVCSSACLLCCSRNYSVLSGVFVSVLNENFYMLVSLSLFLLTFRRHRRTSFPGHTTTFEMGKVGRFTKAIDKTIFVWFCSFV